MYHLSGLDAVHGTPVIDVERWVNEIGPAVLHKQFSRLTDVKLEPVPEAHRNFGGALRSCRLMRP